MFSTYLQLTDVLKFIFVVVGMFIFFESEKLLRVLPRTLKFLTE